MHSINTVQTRCGSQYHCFPQLGVGSRTGEDRPHERNSWASEIARCCQRDCPIERVVGIETDSESGLRLFGKQISAIALLWVGVTAPKGNLRTLRIIHRSKMALGSLTTEVYAPKKNKGLELPFQAWACG
jgi:hypothetical protein